MMSPMSMAAGVLSAGLVASSGYGQCQEFLRIAPAGSEQYDYLGFAVALDGALVVVGAPYGRGASGDSGIAYAYDLLTGELVSHLMAPDGADGDGFGSAVAAEGDVALIGAPGDDDLGPDSGSVYVFDVRTGILLSKLLAGEGEEGDQFGRAVAIDDGIAVVGAPLRDFGGSGRIGSACLFDLKDPRAPVQLSQFRSNDSALRFGDSFDMSEGLLVAVAGFIWGPSAYAFDVTDPESPVQMSTLVLQNDSAFFWNRLGVRVGISGSTAVAGTYAYDYGDGEGSTVSVFDVFTGEQIAAIRPPPDALHSVFGIGVALSGNLLAASSFGDCYVPDTLVYLYDLTRRDDPQLLGAFEPSPGCGSLVLDVDMHGHFAAAGGPWDAGNQEGSGAAYVFDATACGLCPADWDGDGNVDPRDVLRFLNDWVSGEADFNRDGVVDTRDVTAFLGVWAAGC